MLINKTTKQTIQEHDFRNLFTKTIFPIEILDRHLEGTDYLVLRYKDRPTAKQWEKIIDGPIIEEDGYFYQTYQLELLTDEEQTELMVRTKNEYSFFVQSHLDDFAKSKGYDNIVSACSYAATTNQFQEESIRFVNWRSKVWEKCYEIFHKVDIGQIEIPNRDDLLTQLPKFEEIYVRPEFITVSGTTIENGTIIPTTSINSITMRQARLVLYNHGLLEKVTKIISMLDLSVQIEWEFAASVNRDSALVLSMANALEISEEQLDSMFAEASLL